MSRLRLLIGAVAVLLVFSVGATPAMAEDAGGDGNPDNSPVTVIIPRSTTPAVSPATGPDPVGPPGTGAAPVVGTSTPAGGAPAPSCSIGEDGAPVVAATPAATPNALLADRTAYSRGDLVRITGGGYAPSQPVRSVVFTSAPIVADSVADAAGAVAYEFEIPQDATTGELSLQLIGWNCGYVSAVTVLVGDATANASGGVPLWWWLAIVGGLAVIALTLIIVGNSRRWFARPGISTVSP